MNSKLREAIPDIVHRYGLTLDHELREGRTIGEAENTAITEAEKAIRQAVGEEMLELIDAEIEASKKNLAYAEENNHSDRTIANWKGCIEGEMFCRQKIKEWQGGEDE